MTDCYGTIELLQQEAATEMQRARRILKAMTRHAVRHKDCQCCVEILREAGEL